MADQGAVIEGVQSFRRRAQFAGNLKSDGKQVVKAEKEIIIIESANPEVIYVPQYTPSTVVTVGVAPIYGYYPTPYPSYYYPYAPGAAMAAGVIWGAAIGAAWSGNHYGYGGGNNTINVNRNTNINTGNINTGNVNRGARAGAQGGGSAWKSNKQPGQVSNSVGKSAPSARAGDARGGAGAAGGGGSRPSAQPSGMGGGSGGAAAAGGGSRQSAQPSGMGGSAGGSSANRGGSSGGSAFAGAGSSGRQTQMDSSRGAQSRSSASARPPRPSGGGGRRR